MKKKLFIDRFLRLGIKVCMLSGVAFTFAACYGPAEPPCGPEEYWESQEQLDQRLVESDEQSAIEKEETN